MNKIKEIWIKIWGYLNPILTVKGIISFLTSKTFLVILIILVILGLGRSCAKNRDAQRIINIRQQNIYALNDTIRSKEIKLGKKEYTIAIYVTGIKNLEKLNNDLYKEIKDEKGKVISLNKIVLGFEQNEIQLRDHINYLQSLMDNPIRLNDSTFKIPWKLVYDWDTINYDIFKGQTIVGLTIKPGYTWGDAITPTRILGAVLDTTKFGVPFNENNIIGIKHYKTEIINRESQIDLSFGQKVEGNKFSVFVKSNYPGFTAKSLSGVLIDPNTNPYIRDIMKKKKWIPNTWSIGLGPSFGYNVLTNKLYLGIGVNVNYNLLQW